jgi:signal transduction histidine kinase
MKLGVRVAGRAAAASGIGCFQASLLLYADHAMISDIKDAKIERSEVAMDTSALLHDLSNELNVVLLAIEMAETRDHPDADDFVLRNLRRAGAACERCRALIESVKQGGNLRVLPDGS